MIKKWWHNLFGKQNKVTEEIDPDLTRLMVMTKKRRSKEVMKVYSVLTHYINQVARELDASIIMGRKHATSSLTISGEITHTVTEEEVQQLGWTMVYYAINKSLHPIVSRQQMNKWIDAQINDSVPMDDDTLKIAVIGFIRESVKPIDGLYDMRLV